MKTIKPTVIEQPKTLQDHKPGEIYTPEQRLELLSALDKYVDSTSYPIIYEFAVEHNIFSGTITGWSESEQTVKKVRDKQAAYIHRQLVDDKVNPIRYIYLAKALLKLYDTPSQVTPQGDSMTITLTGQPSGKLVDTMAKFAQGNKQVNQGK